MEELRQDIEQIWPAHADHISYYKDSFVNDLFKESKVVAQRKYDGERMLIHFINGKVVCTSRRISKKTNRYQENQDRLLPIQPLDVDYTVIDCECYGDTWSDSASVLHSLPERALELQQTTKLHFACFDCLFFKGKDVRGEPYSARMQMLNEVLSLIEDDRFHQVDQIYIDSKEDAYNLAEAIWATGGEGIVIKATNKAYYDKAAMLKIKRFETVDVVVYDYQEGRGKYEGVVGALLVGYYDADSNTLKHLSKVNCGTDEDRKMWKEWFDKGIAVGQVIEVKCQEITDRSLRHPVYVRVREDKGYSECSRDTIFKE